MDYKISETQLKLREFGRNIQAMVEKAKLMDDDEMRNALVHEIVRIMTNINPGVKDQPDYEQKLWDALYHLAEYDIDVKSDFPMPPPDSFQSRPKERMSYGTGRPRFRQYGNNVEFMIAEALKMEEGEEKEALIKLIANTMKMHLKDTSKDANVEMTVVEHIKAISRGKITPTVEEIDFYRGPAKNNIKNVPSLAPLPGSRKKKKKKRK